MAKKRAGQILLKPQEVLLVLKLCSDKRSETATYVELSKSTGLTASETHASEERAELAGLLVKDSAGRHANRRSVVEFLLHGVKYAFPVVRGRVVRGMPTSYGAAPLNQRFGDSVDAAPVWPYAKGTVRGPSIAPLYRTVPDIALKDVGMYELLALLDAIREGRAREREIAAELLRERIE